MAKNYNLLEHYEWLGEFWFEEDSKKMFSGILSYSPSSGIVLKCLFGKLAKQYRDIFEEKFKKGELIQGYTQETGAITLSYVYSSEKTQGNFVTTESITCDFAVLGHHFKKDVRLKGYLFTFNNLDEFCYPQHRKFNDFYEKEKILSAKIDSMNIELIKQAIGTTYGNQISNMLMSDNKELKKDLDEAVSKVMNKHKTKFLDIKKEMHYYFSLRSNKKKHLSYKECHKTARKILDLFKCLMLRRLVFTEIIAYVPAVSNGKRYNKRCTILIPLYLEERVVKSIMKSEDYNYLPVNMLGVKENFGSIVNSWDRFKNERFNIVLQTIINHIYNHVDCFQHYVLLIASIDQWSFWENIDSKIKYDGFINNHANEKIKSKLLEMLPSGIKNEELGKALGDIRNCIIHPPKQNTKEFKKYSSVINYAGISNLSELVYFVLVVALYKKIGVEKKYIEKFLRNIDFRQRIFETFND